MPLRLSPDFAVHAQTPRLRDALRAVFPRAVETDDAGAIELSEGDGFLTWRGAPLLPVAADTAWPPLIESLLTHAIGQTPGWVGLHAACLRWRGRDWIFPGDRGSGKSSLALALLEAGAEYGTDEVLRSREAPGSDWWAVPKAPTVKAAHSPFARGGQTLYADPFRGDLQYPLPAAWRAEEPLRDPLVVFPVFAADAAPEIWRLSPGLSLMALGQQVFGGLRQRPLAFARLAELAARPAWRIRYGRSSDALDILSRIAEGAEAPLAKGVAWPSSPSAPPVPGGAEASLRAAWHFAAPRVGVDPGPTPPKDWVADRWLALLEAHRLEGLMVDLPGASRAGGESRLRAAARDGLRRWEALRLTLGDLSPLREELCLLKGPVLLGSAYPYVAARAWTDLDVLARDPAAARARLLGLGYTEGRALNEHHHLAPLRHPLSGLVVEIHADLSVPPLGREAMSWFWARRCEWSFGGLSFSALDRAGLRAHAALHAINNPVDGASLRDLLEFAALDGDDPEEPPHPRVAAAVARCRRLLARLRGDPTSPDALDRILWRALLEPPGCRTRWEEFQARVDRQAVERWHLEGKVTAPWTLWVWELRRGLRARRESSPEGREQIAWGEGEGRVSLDPADGALRLG